LTCATRRRVVSKPSIVEPVSSPIPPATIVPVETENRAVTVRVAKNLAEEIHERNFEIPIEPLEDTVFLVDLVIKPQTEKNIATEANEIGFFLQTAEFLFSSDRFLACQKASLEKKLGDLDLRES
jgi:hypothetical protein